MWKLIDYYDIWTDEEGNAGVNDVREFDITLSENPTDQEILNALYNMEYLKTNDMSKFMIVWQDDNWCEISTADEDMPICRVVKE